MKHNLNTLKMAVYSVILIVVFTGIIGAASTPTTIKVAGNGHYFEYEGKQEFLLGLGNWILINNIDVNYTTHSLAPLRWGVVLDADILSPFVGATM